MSISVARQMTVSVDGYPHCVWNVTNETTVDGVTYGEVDLTRCDPNAVAIPTVGPL